MVLTDGFEPSLTGPQPVVLTANTKSGLFWCTRKDLNLRHPGLQPSALPD